MCGASMAHGWGSYGSVKFKNTGLQGSTLFGHHITTGFAPFDLPTCGLLQKGWDHSLALSEEPGSWLAFTVLC